MQSRSLLPLGGNAGLQVSSMPLLIYYSIQTNIWFQNCCVNAFLSHESLFVPDQSKEVNSFVSLVVTMGSVRFLVKKKKAWDFFRESINSGSICCDLPLSPRVQDRSGETLGIGV